MTNMPQISNHSDARSSIYRLLSLSFRYPKVEVFKTFQSGEFFGEIRDCVFSLPHLNALQAFSVKIRNELEGMDFWDFEARFVLTFDAGSPFPPCPPYEGMYIEPRTAVLLEVSEFYRCFGLAMSQKEGKREFPDHISAELEFLHFLTFKEAQAIANDDKEFLKGYLLAQKDFLERHPLRWAPEFCKRLMNSGVPFYARLAEVTSVFLACEHELVTSRLKALAL